MWFQIKDQHVEIRVFAKPKAKRTALLKVNEEGLNIALHAKPHEGEANIELISFLSKFFEIPKSSVILLRGIKSKYKVVEVPLTSKILDFIQSHA